MMVKIRVERESDWDAIRDVTEQAFRGKPYAGEDEHILIDKMREEGVLALSLVAVDTREQVVGQVSFSLARLGDGGSGPWYALGPVAVVPTRQGEGIGSQLIDVGLSSLCESGALGCILVGDPNYYERFGFQLYPEACPEAEPPEYFMLKFLLGAEVTGRFSFDPVFYALGA